MDNHYVKKNLLLEKLKKDLINKLHKIINSFDGEIKTSEDSLIKKRLENEENILKLE